MQGNNYGLLVKTKKRKKKMPKSPFRSAGLVLTFANTKFARFSKIENLLQGLFPFIYKTVYGFVMGNL